MRASKSKQCLGKTVHRKHSKQFHVFIIFIVLNFKQDKIEINGLSENQEITRNCKQNYPALSHNVISLLGIYPQENKSFYQKDTCSCTFIAALFTIEKTCNQPKCQSMIEWTKKMWHIYTMEYYAVIKKNEFMFFAGTWMKLETIILSKLTQEWETKHRMFPPISGS